VFDLIEGEVGVDPDTAVVFLVDDDHIGFDLEGFKLVEEAFEADEGLLDEEGDVLDFEVFELGDFGVTGVNDELEVGFLKFFLYDLEGIDFDDGEIGFLSPVIELEFLFELMILDCKDVFFESLDVEGLYEFGAGGA
jgi:hypothetical protein